MSKELTEESLRRCRARAKANRSSLEQEVFLLRGGTLDQWYALSEPLARVASDLLRGEDLDAGSRAVAYRMVTDLMVEFASSLKRKEIASLCKAARVIAQEPYEAERNRLERETVDRAFAMVVDGE